MWFWIRRSCTATQRKATASRPKRAATIVDVALLAFIGSRKLRGRRYQPRRAEPALRLLRQLRRRRREERVVEVRLVLRVSRPRHQFVPFGQLRRREASHPQHAFLRGRRRAPGPLRRERIEAPL